jgi:hypothetical protein
VTKIAPPEVMIGDQSETWFCYGAWSARSNTIDSAHGDFRVPGLNISSFISKLKTLEKAFLLHRNSIRVWFHNSVSSTKVYDISSLHWLA